MIFIDNQNPIGASILPKQITFSWTADHESCVSEIAAYLFFFFKSSERFFGLINDLASHLPELYNLYPTRFYRVSHYDTCQYLEI